MSVAKSLNPSSIPVETLRDYFECPVCYNVPR